MIDFLLSLGISENEIKDIMEFNKYLLDYGDYEKNIEILKIIGCDDKEIKNIIISNPNILIRDSNDIINLVKCFNKYRFSYLNILFDSNPFLLNKDDYELEEYIKEKKNMGLGLDEIIDLLDSEPYDFY